MFGRILAAIGLTAALLNGAQAVEKLLHVRVTMRDKVKLDTNVFHPAANARYPAILIRTPYGKGPDLPAGYLYFVEQGYAVVLQDVRGRYESEGGFRPLEQEGADGWDTLEWIARQPWSSGSVGMLGGSYLGIAQWKVAVLNNPHLKAIFPVVSGYDDYMDRFYSPGGAMKLGHRLLWLSENLLLPGLRRPPFLDYVSHLPLRTADRTATGQTIAFYQQSLDHPAYDSFWKHLSVRQEIAHVRAAVFAVGGWYDNYVESDLEAFSALEKASAKPEAGKHNVLIGPWPHNMSLKFAGIDYGQDAGSPIRRYQVEFFDRWVKGVPEVRPAHFDPEDGPVHLFVMGANRWRVEREWPLARTRYTPLFLSGKGRAKGSEKDNGLEWKIGGKDQPDEYVYDPKNPTPTMGGAVCCNPKVFPWGPLDQRGVESRKDVLAYTSAPLKREIEVTGTVRVVLYASTSAPDTDFTAKLVDVFPSGEARNLTDGILRLRYRHGLDKPELANPGEIYPLTIDAGVTSNVFRPGHRIRVEISSSNFPRFDRNPNTGRPIADETELRKARQSVYHGAQFPSHVLLPVIPETREGAAGKKTTGPGLGFRER